MINDKTSILDPWIEQSHIQLTCNKCGPVNDAIKIHTKSFPWKDKYLCGKCFLRIMAELGCGEVDMTFAPKEKTEEERKQEKEELDKEIEANGYGRVL